MVYLAFSSTDNFVSKDNRWIASLSDGSTVFEDKTPGIISAWKRLKEYTKLHNLKISNLRLEVYDKKIILIPYKDDSGNAQINGYWHCNKINTIFMPGRQLESIWRGIGYVKGKKIYITWAMPNGEIYHEIQDYINDDITIIINDEV